MATALDLAEATRESFIEKMAIDTFFRKHPLMEVMWRQKKRHSGGSTIDWRMKDGDPGDFSIYSGDSVGAVPTGTDIFFSASLPWRKALYQLYVTGDTDIQNKSDAQIIDVFKETMGSGMEGLVTRLNTEFVTGTGAANRLHGLPTLFDPVSYAGITWAAHTTAEPITVDATTFATTTLDREKLEDAITQIDERKGTAQVILMSRAQRMALTRLVESDNSFRYEYGSKSQLEIGVPPKLYFMGTEIMVELTIPDNVVYVLDMTKFHLVTSSDAKRNFSIGSWRYLLETDRLDAYAAHAQFAGNFICRQPNVQARITNLTL